MFGSGDVRNAYPICAGRVLTILSIPLGPRDVRTASDMAVISSASSPSGMSELRTLRRDHIRHAEFHRFALLEVSDRCESLVQLRTLSLNAALDPTVFVTPCWAEVGCAVAMAEENNGENDLDFSTRRCHACVMRRRFPNWGRVRQRRAPCAGCILLSRILPWIL